MNIVVAYRGIPHARGRETGAALARAFSRLGHTVFEYGNVHGSSIAVGGSALPQSADVLVHCECNDSDPQYYELRKIDAGRRVYWDFDISTHALRTWLFMQRMRFDVVFYANPLFKDVIESASPRVSLLPYAIDDEYHQKLTSVNKEIDIALVGSPYPARVELVDKLHRAGIKARIIHGVFGAEFIRCINSIRVHLNYNTSKTRGLLVARVWETMGCGTALLTQKLDHIDNYFVDGEHFASYSDTEQCIERARQLLDDDHSRETMALAGMAAVHSNHTYVSRAQSILDVIAHSPARDHSARPRIRAPLQAIRLAMRYGVRSRPIGD